MRMVITPPAAALNLEQLGQLADRIMEASPTPTIAATNTHTQLTTQVTELTQRLISSQALGEREMTSVSKTRDTQLKKFKAIAACKLPGGQSE